MFKKNELGSDSFIIAEVGQNHQGDLEIARKYIKSFSEIGANAIKFQIRDNKYLFDEGAYNKEYNSENAFASTYGEHREKLELAKEELIILKNDCHYEGVKFMVTPFDEPSLELLADIGVDIIKISSFDLGNLPFVKRIAAKKIPVVVSVGGGKSEHIESTINLLREYLDEIAILHCVSEYPCPHEKLGLDNIEKLISKFPDCTIGLSDHFKGIVSGPVAYMKGARVFEKHVTFDRTWKGTDHAFALMHHGFRNFVRDIKRVPEMMSPKEDEELGKEYVFTKLGKSLIVNSNLSNGDMLTLDNLSGKIFEKQYLPVRQSGNVIGKKVARDMRAGEPIVWDDLI